MKPNNLEEVQKIFESEIRTAALAFYTWKSINNIAAEDSEIKLCLNRDALFWNSVLYSLQSTTFISLGRMFDVDHGALSVHSYLRKCLELIEQFNIQHLRNRKIKLSSGKNQDWLVGYLSSAEIPSLEEIRLLKRESKNYKKLYEKTYEPIRNKIYAHKDISSLSDTEVLFSQTRIGDIQRML